MISGPPAISGSSEVEAVEDEQEQEASQRLRIGFVEEFTRRLRKREKPNARVIDVKRRISKGQGKLSTDLLNRW
jgi:hypothetical protein